MKANGKFKIDKGVPIPHGVGGVKSELMVAFAEMKVGDSVYVEKPRTIISGSLQWFCKAGKYSDRFKVRTEGKGARVWRIA